MSESTSFVRGWLRGFFDGEGSVSFRKMDRGRKHTTYCISVTNTDYALMDTCQTYLTQLGIEFREWRVRVRGNRRPARTLHIGKGESIVKFARAVGFAAPKKAGALAEVVAWINRPYSKYTVMLPKLDKLHNERGMSIREIVKFLGMRPGGHHRLAALMRAAGIHVREGRSTGPCSYSLQTVTSPESSDSDRACESAQIPADSLHVNGQSE